MGLLGYMGVMVQKSAEFTRPGERVGDRMMEAICSASSQPFKMAINEKRRVFVGVGSDGIAEL